MMCCSTCSGAGADKCMSCVEGKVRCDGNTVGGGQGALSVIVTVACWGGNIPTQILGSLLVLPFHISF